MLAAMRAMDGRRVLEAAPVAEQTTAFWDAVKSYFAEPIAKKIIRKNETDRLLEFPGGGRIRCKTAWDADTLRGDYADLLILDEYSYMQPDAWEQVGLPMLLDNNGDAVFIFTPNRRNHAYALYSKALSDMTGRYGVWHFASMANPYLSKQALSDMIAEMGEEAYRQEILAEFLEGAGAVFRNISACMTAPLEVDPKKHAEHVVVAGVDWGKQSDSTAISIGCATCKVEIARDRYSKIDYTFQRERLKTLAKKYHVKRMLVELNSIGEPNFEQLQRDGVPVSGFTTTAQSKPPLIENLALALERGEWRFQDDPVWTSELEAYERRVQAVTGRSSYSAPDGLHDDTVMARALMLHSAQSGNVVLFMI